MEDDPLKPSVTDSSFKKTEEPSKESEELRKNREKALLRKQQFQQRMANTPPPKIESGDQSDDATNDKYKNNLRQYFEGKITLLLDIFDRDRFRVKGINIPEDIIQIVDSFGGKLLNESNSWTVPLSNYYRFRAEIYRRSTAEINDIPRFVILLMQNPNSSMKTNYTKQYEKVPSLESLPYELKTKMYPFQRDGVRFVISKHGRVLIGDEMGVGKTVQAIASAFLYFDEWPVLVICPASLKFNWRDEFMKWLPQLKRNHFFIVESGRKPQSDAKVWIVSYTMATSQHTLMSTHNFGVIIADECHYLKSYTAQRTKAIIPILQASRRVILLSGTPMISRPSEIYNILTALRPDIFRSFFEFANRYCGPKKLLSHTDFSGISHAKELYSILNSCLMIRRLKSDVLSELPAKIRQKVEIPAETQQCKAIRKIYSDVATSKANSLPPLEGNQFINQAYLLTCKAKITGVCDYINYLLECECKFIVFAHHIEMMNAIQEKVEGGKVKFIRIDGKTQAEKRQDLVNEFQSNKDCKVAILSILAAGVGITLTAASLVVIAEMAWSPSVMVQAEDRAHRVGQTKSVNIHYLFGPATLDEYIWPKIQAKLSVISKALDNDCNPENYSLFNPECKLGFGDFDTEDLYKEIKHFNAYF